MIRLQLIALLVSIGLLLPASPGLAAAGSARPAGQTAQATPTAPSANDLKSLLGTLQNADKRQALIAQIKTLIAVRENAGAAHSHAGLGARVSGTLSSGFSWVADAPHALAAYFQTPLSLWSAIARQITNPAQRTLWLRTLGYPLLGLAVGSLASLLIGLMIARRRRQTAFEPLPFPHNIRRAAGRFAVDLVPILAFSAPAFGMAAVAPLSGMAQLALFAIIDAIALSLAGMVLARAVLSPLASPLRLAPLDDASAAYLYVWTKRLIISVVWSYVILETGVLLGMSHAVYLAGAKILGLFVTMLLVVFILQNRATVASWLRRGTLAFIPLRALPATFRNRVSEVWHIVATAYLLAVYIVWALAIPGGLAYLFRATAETAVVIALLLFAEVWVRRGLERLFRIDAGMLASYPLLARRANRYVPALRLTLLYGLRTMAVLAILAAWQVNVGSILLSPAGRTVLGHLSIIVFIALLALLAWEIASGAITAYLSRTDTSGQAVVRSARVRTLLPLVRNVLLVTISVLSALVILSELGVNIAPLLAGAGVVGLALGFGAQSLVKDVISGAFILLEGTINVGDIAVINGQSGLVEDLTIRSIRLRDLAGSVHTVTFGSVTSITNMTKDYSYYVFKVGVAYRENTDEVVALLREIDEDMRADPEYGPKILEPIDILGIDEFADSAVIISARTKTLPIKQWSVGREFNRRMKLKFDERGIEMPFPHRTIYFGEDKTGMAPSAHVALHREAQERQASIADDSSDRAQERAALKEPDALASGS